MRRRAVAPAASPGEARWFLGARHSCSWRLASAVRCGQARARTVRIFWRSARRVQPRPMAWRSRKPSALQDHARRRDQPVPSALRSDPWRAILGRLQLEPGPRCARRPAVDLPAAAAHFGPTRSWATAGFVSPRHDDYRGLPRHRPWPPGAGRDHEVAPGGLRGKLPGDQRDAPERRHEPRPLAPTRARGARLGVRSRETLTVITGVLYLPTPLGWIRSRRRSTPGDPKPPLQSCSTVRETVVK